MSSAGGFLHRHDVTRRACIVLQNDEQYIRKACKQWVIQVSSSFGDFCPPPEAQKAENLIFLLKSPTLIKMLHMLYIS